MAEKIFVQGNEAVGWGAVSAGCLYFFGYPITPQNEITEWFARELPQRGGIFVQSESEGASINMLYGAAAVGVRAMTSTASPGWGLMQEGMSHLAMAELPCVVVLVQRGGPGQGTTRHGQTDYLSVTRCGAAGGYKNIVLAPASVQEICELVQLAFYLADKYRNPVVVLSDGLLGQAAESLEVRTLDFGPLPEKDWALLGSANRKSQAAQFIMSSALPSYVDRLKKLDDKYRQMTESELRYKTYLLDDARLVLVSYGYTARVSREAMHMARSEGLKVGMIRPITLWPFPYRAIREKALQGCKFLVVEDSLGQLVDDVSTATEGQAEVHLVGVTARHDPGDGGMIFPERVFEEIRKLL